jgi:uncharacterized membrane protein YfcA
MVADSAASGLVDWQLAGVLIEGGVLDGLLGARSAKALSVKKGDLTSVFAALIFAAAISMLVRSIGPM